jgi:cyanate lyase
MIGADIGSSMILECWFELSAIDFDMQIEREPNPKGDRVRISMSGKFLPYKRY